MRRLIKLTPVVAFATLLSACGVLEWNTPAASNSGPLFTPSGETSGATLGEAAKLTVASATNSKITGQFTGQIKEIFKTERCNELSRGGFIWFKDSVVLNDWLSPLGTDLISRVNSEVDFSQQGVLLVDFGVAASSGAGVELLSNQLGRRGQEAIFQIKQNKTSAAGKKRIQMVTHPCSLYVMPRVGYDLLVVQSEQGDRLTTFKN